MFFMIKIDKQLEKNLFIFYFLIYIYKNKNFTNTLFFICKNIYKIIVTLNILMIAINCIIL